MNRIFTLLLAVVVSFSALLAPVSAQPSSLSTDEALYVGRATGWSAMASESLNRVSTLSENPQFGTLKWENDVLAETGLWSALYRDVLSVDAPDRFQKTHEHIIKGFAALDTSGAHLRIGVEGYDANEISVAAQYIQEFTTEVGLATAALK